MEQDLGSRPKTAPQGKRRRARTTNTRIILEHIQCRIATYRGEIGMIDAAWRILESGTITRETQTHLRNLLEERCALDIRCDEMYRIREKCFPKIMPPEEEGLFTRSNHPWIRRGGHREENVIPPLTNEAAQQRPSESEITEETC